MIRKKVAILFGAGAVLDWGAPKTICNRDKLTFIPEHGSDEIRNRVCCLTHLITATGFKNANGENITNKIYQKLLSKNKENVNFETIINILEDLYSYWSIKQSKNSRSLLSVANLDNSISDYHFFEHTEPNPVTNFYSISIPGFPLLKEDFISKGIHPNQKYYEMFLDELLSGIVGHVSKYSYYTSGHNVIFKEVNEEINRKFCNWARRLANGNSSLRMYTLNYDRMFKVLLQNDGIDVFEGFDLDGLSTKPGELIAPNINRIVTDFSCNVHYNLHGSAYWSIYNENGNDMPGYQYYLSGVPETNDKAAIIEIESNRRLLLTNIITGYQKVQKTATSPFRQMLSAFDRDCIETDVLYIIGYSFGDEHINDIIRNARKYNQKLEIIVINPTFNDEQFMFDFILHWGSPKGIIYKNEGQNVIVSPDYKVQIICNKFSDFLNQTNAA